MSKLFSIMGATVVMLGGINAKAEELPALEKFGFPITQSQVSVLGSADVRERPLTLTLMLDGMPASPHQLAVLSPRPRIAKEWLRTRLMLVWRSFQRRPAQA